MADIEDNTASARAKRPVGIASAAGRRERRAPASKDLDIEHVKPTRRAAAPAAAAEHSSDHSEDTGIEGTDAPENATARPASRGKAAPRKGAPAPDTKAASSGSDEDSAAATPKLAKAAKVTAQAKKKETPAGKTEEVAVRQRPTNNQLLYKARFNWEHYTHAVAPGTREMLPSETQACASVTSAFLQVLKAIHVAETRRDHGGRNILKLLSVNTRRTKVVALSTGTHRVPDELRRHQLSDDDGNEYSTNLDRNRYGADDQYLFTVIKFNLEALGLCPLICQVEIIDAKAQGAEDCLVVKVPEERCCCRGEPPAPSGDRRADRVVVGGSATHPHRAAAAAAAAARSSEKAPRAPESTGKSDRAQWRVPAAPMSPLKRAASAGDAGGMGVLLDALTQVGGMPPPSPLHLRSPSHAARRQSYLSSGAMAAASPSMRPAAVAMSALCEEAPPSVTRPEGAGGVGGVAAAAAAAAAAAHFYGVGTPLAAQQNLFFQSPPAMREAARQAAAAIANAGAGAAPLEAFGAFDGRAALEEMVERVSGEAAAAKAAEAKAKARVAELEDQLAAAKAPSSADEVDAAAAAAKLEQKAEAAEKRLRAFAEETATRAAALEEEVAAFGARVAAATTALGGAGAEATLSALYLAEAQAHARALTRVARLEAAAARAGGAPEEKEAAPPEAAAAAAEPASPSAVAAIAAQAVAEKRGREDDACAFEPPPPPSKRASARTEAATTAFGVAPRDAAKAATAATAAAMAAAAAAGYAPPTTPSLAPLDPNGVFSPPGTDPAQITRVSYAAR